MDCVELILMRLLSNQSVLAHRQQDRLQEKHGALHSPPALSSTWFTSATHFPDVAICPGPVAKSDPLILGSPTLCHKIPGFTGFLILKSSVCTTSAQNPPS